MLPNNSTQQLPRAAGILLHPTSLCTPYGIGDLGPMAYEFIRFLKKAGQSFWQVLPLGPTGYGDSPYQCLSAFAGNPLLISPDILIKQEYLTKEEVLGILGGPEGESKKRATSKNVDYGHVIELKNRILSKSFENFYNHKEQFQADHQSFGKYCDKEASWLNDYVLFYSLKKEHKLQSWTTWKPMYVERNKNALKVWEAMKKKELVFYRYIQWVFDLQWRQLKSYANEQGVQIIGDVPIFVAHDSADVWSHPEYFTLNPDGTLTHQAGVPPDYFSKTGQLWGNPLYRWNILEQEDFSWFIGRIKRIMEMVDWVRIDHFRGFQAYWQVAGDEKTAIEGKWVEAPGEALFTKILAELGSLPILAEDLGIITPEVEALRDQFGFPGMKVLQFAFSSDEENPHLPHNYVRNSLVYSGTHDNNTAWGWWNDESSTVERSNFVEYLNSSGQHPVEDMIKAIYRSVATLAIVPFQDVLGKGSDARMNTPSVPMNNWQYITEGKDYSEKRANWLRNLVKIYRRLPISIKANK